jgi:hypothetical protein
MFFRERNSPYPGSSVSKTKYRDKVGNTNTHALLRAPTAIGQCPGLATVPMAIPPPRFTAAPQTVVLPPLNGFQQGSIGNLLRTFRNGHYSDQESHPK